MGLNIIEKKPLVITLLRDKGPSLPSQVSGEIGLSLLFTSALLSEMVSDKMVLYSYLKVGGSPLYFLPGQEEKLENFSNHLHGKEKEALQLLKERQVLCEDELEPVQRVCLGNMKDFAIPVKFNYKNQPKLFWRYYMFPEKESFTKMEEYFAKLPKPPKVETDKKIGEFEKPDEIRDTINKLKEENAIKPLHPVGMDEKEKLAEANKEVKVEVRIEEQRILHPEILKKSVKKRVQTKKKQDFTSRVLDYVKEKDMLILKNFDEDNKICVAELESAVGSMKFLIFGLNKKSLNESDLSLAFSEGQHERLPVLLITNGKLTKKAEEYQKKLGNYIIINKI